MVWIYKNILTKKYYTNSGDVVNIYEASTYASNCMMIGYGMTSYDRIEFNSEFKNIRRKKLEKLCQQNTLI